MKARENPFRSERVLVVRYRPQDADWPTLMRRLEALRFRAAIVGPKGTGKTTLLEDLAPRLAQRGLRPRILRAPDRLAPPDPAGMPIGDAHASSPPWDRGSPHPLFTLPPPGPDDALLIDSAENLSWLAWRRLLAHARLAGALLITAHRPGRLPTLLHTRTSPELLRQIVDQLLANPSTTPHPAANATVANLPSTLPPIDPAALFARHRGNLREALRELYLHAANL